MGTKREGRKASCSHKITTQNAQTDTFIDDKGDILAAPQGWNSCPCAIKFCATEKLCDTIPLSSRLRTPKHQPFSLLSFSTSCVTAHPFFQRFPFFVSFSTFPTCLSLPPLHEVMYPIPSLISLSGELNFPQKLPVEEVYVQYEEQS